MGDLAGADIEAAGKRGALADRVAPAAVGQRDRPVAQRLRGRAPHVPPFDLALDRELWRWTPEPVSLYVTRTARVDGGVNVEQALALGDLDAIARACRDVSTASPAVTAYLCTSAS